MSRGEGVLQSLIPAGAPVCWGESDQTPGYTAQDGWRPAGPQFNTESRPDNRGHTHAVNFNTHTHTNKQTSQTFVNAPSDFIKTIAAHTAGSRPDLGTWQYCVCLTCGAGLRVLGEQTVLTHGLFYSVPQVWLDVVQTVFGQDQGQADGTPAHRMNEKRECLIWWQM